MNDNHETRATRLLMRLAPLLDYALLAIAFIALTMPAPHTASRLDAPAIEQSAKPSGRA